MYSLLAIFILIVLLSLILIYAKYLQKLYFWRRHNVELISIREFIRKHRVTNLGIVVGEYYQQMYKERTPFKVIEGLLTSVIIVQDLKIISDIMITQFENFSDRGLYSNPRDPLSTMLMKQDYKTWKLLKQKFSPAFTPAKMKYMFPTLLKVGTQFGQLMEDRFESGESEAEIYDLCARYITDIMGNTIFGIESNNLRDLNAEFRVRGEKALSNHLHPLLDLFAAKHTKLLQFFNYKVYDKKSTNFFVGVVRETLEYREKHNIRGQDFMDILLDLKNDRQKNDEVNLTLELMVGQAFAFFVGGFETGARTMTNAFYELAKNPEIQVRARQEVVDVMAKYDNKLTYEGLAEMNLIKQIVLETLRKYPSITTMIRVSRNPYTIRTSPTTSITIPGNTSFLLPFYGLHHNPDFFPEPEVFRPERFTDEEIAKRVACTYMPFGIGPKMCIGERFAKMQICLGVALLLSQFQFLPCKRTPDKLQFDPVNRFSLFSKEGVYLRVEKLVK